MAVRGVDPGANVRIHVHSGLRGLCDDQRLPFREPGILIEFADPLELNALADPVEPILVPVTNPMQVELLRSLRQKCCMTCIVAVVNDVNGYQTYQAMSSGATCVFNLAIPVSKQIDTLYAVFAAHSGAMGQEIHLVPDGGASPESALNAAEPGPPLDEANRFLISLLCGSHTISSIAKRFYCSERSMYRRVRRIYDVFGVSGRNELRSIIAASEQGAERAS